MSPECDRIFMNKSRTTTLPSEPFCYVCINLDFIVALSSKSHRQVQYMYMRVQSNAIPSGLFRVHNVISSTTLSCTLLYGTFTSEYKQHV